MRTIGSHRADSLTNSPITVSTDYDSEPSTYVVDHGGAGTYIRFQRGPVLNGEGNGLTNEALLAVVIDRLEVFQAGPLECAYNQDALDHLRKALSALHDRTLSRRARDVEGSSVP